MSFGFRPGVGAVGGIYPGVLVSQPNGPTIYSDGIYPNYRDHWPSDESAIRYVGGTGASNNNNGLSRATAWGSWDYALDQLSRSTTWYMLVISGDVTSDQELWTKTPTRPGPGTSSQYAIVRGDPQLGQLPNVTLNHFIRIDGQQYWHWSDFNYVSPFGVQIAVDLPTYYHTFRNITGTLTGLGGDNYGLIQTRNASADYLGIFNCHFVGPGVGGGIHGNTAGIIIFRPNNFRMMNNVGEAFPRVFYYKHTNQTIAGPAQIYIENNWHKGPVGQSLFACQSNQVNNTGPGMAMLRNNIFDTGILISNDGGGDQIRDYDIRHNTIRGDLVLNHSNHPVINSTIMNNIIEDDAEFLRYLAGVHNDTNVYDYNLIGDRFYQQGNEYSLAAWQAYSGQSSNSRQGLPIYAGGANLTVPSDYALTPESPGYRAANDGLDMGANVALVGNVA